FRPLETMGFEGLRRAATSAPAFGEAYAEERLQLLSRLEQRWSGGRPESGGARSTCVAPVPRRNYSAGASRPSSSGSLVDDDLASLELRGIFSVDGAASPASRSSSATSACSAPPADHDLDLFPLEEIVVPTLSPITRSANPMPLDAGFGAPF
ncbi:hypothetical protein H4S01_006926, partial [Coemansia sp. RSA 2610]